MQQFPVYATTFKLSYQNFFLDSCFCNTFQRVQQFFSFSIRNSSWVLHMQPFPVYATVPLAFLSESFLEACLCNNFWASLSELLPDACLCNNLKLMQQFFSLTFRTSAWRLLMQNLKLIQQFFSFPIRKFPSGLLMQQFPVDATIF